MAYSPPYERSPSPARLYPNSRPHKQRKIAHSPPLISRQPTKRDAPFKSIGIEINKPRRHLKRGAWAKMLELPNEILENIFADFTPRELLRLSRVDKRCRYAMLVAWNPRAWKIARFNFFQAPAPPEGMSEPEFASYLAEKVCSVCGGKAVVVDPVIRIRACKKHFEEQAIPLTPFYMTKLYSNPRPNAPDMFVIQRFVPTIVHSNRTWAQTEMIYAVVEEYTEMFGDWTNNERRCREWQKGMIEQTNDECQLQSQITEWRRRAEMSRRGSREALVRERKLTILTKLRALGYFDKDLKEDKTLFHNNAWEALMSQPQEVTTEHWSQIYPKIEAIMINRRKIRVEDESRKSKENRRALIEATLLDVMEQQIDTAPWNSIYPNPMSGHFHAAMPELDKIPLARSYIQGHHSRMPARDKVASDTQTKAEDQILRTRALLAKLLCAADEVQSTTNASASVVSLDSRLVKILEQQVDNMTKEQLLEGDSQARDLLYHPTAFFYPVKTRNKPPVSPPPSTETSLKGSLVRTPVSNNPLSAQAMIDELLSTSSATSFYPAVFRKSYRPERTTPMARELRVDSVLRQTAAYILGNVEPKLDIDLVMELALKNAAAFQCSHCLDLGEALGGEMLGAVNWTQMVHHYAEATGRTAGSAAATPSALDGSALRSEEYLTAQPKSRCHENPRVLIVDPSTLTTEPIEQYAYAPEFTEPCRDSHAHMSSVASAARTLSSPYFGASTPTAEHNSDSAMELELEIGIGIGAPNSSENYDENPGAPLQFSLQSPHVHPALSPLLTHWHTEPDEVGSSLPSHPSLELDYTVDSFPGCSSRRSTAVHYDPYRNEEGVRSDADDADYSMESSSRHIVWGHGPATSLASPPPSLQFATPAGLRSTKFHLSE